MMYLYRRYDTCATTYLITDNEYSFYLDGNNDFSSTIKMIHYGWDSSLESPADRHRLICSFETIDELKSNFPEFFL